MKLIQEENAALRRRLEELEASASKTSAEDMWAMVEARVQARLESALMGPAQRPALAHETRARPSPAQDQEGERKREGEENSPRFPIPTPVAGPSSAPPQAVAGPSAAKATEAESRTKKSRDNGKKEATAPGKKTAPNHKPPPKVKGKKPPPQAQPAPEPRPLPPAPASMETPWVEVVSRNRKKRKPAVAVNTQPRQPARRAEPKLRPPRSAAVVISLTPAAVAKGLSYKQVLTDAQSKLDLTGLDITRLRPKFAATGAPMRRSAGANLNDGDVVQEISGEKPMEGVARSSVATEVDSDSSGSVSSVRSRRLWRRHSRSIDSWSLNLTSDTDEPVPKAQTTDGRGRGRPPTTKPPRHERGFEEVRACGAGHCPQIGQSEGNVQKALNWVTNTITQYIEQPQSALIARLESESKKWQELSARLEANLKTVQEENAALKQRLEGLEAATKGPPIEEMLAMVEARVEARLESARMGPAQRPALAHEKRMATGDTQLPVSGGIVGGPAPPKTKREKGKGEDSLRSPSPPQYRTSSAAPQYCPPTEKEESREEEGDNDDVQAEGPKGNEERPSGTIPLEPRPTAGPASMETPWVEVVSRKKKKPAAAANTQPQQPARRAEPKLRPPRSAAVVITLTPAAVAKGLS
ncbi:serine/arginine repetitive matrix protein 1-like [Manduca sexta]|uniref:serine/arginine repetitive matrix protein 1-like n=1 Tax=Manduca sexta TaxID=7130 RepID=UPI00188EBA27|nr:serine/arginine repetitive matrix protein 1-like [Manduca sexta]